MTTQVKENEVSAITDFLEKKAEGYKPKIMYCLVERKNLHRFFHNVNGDLLNPDPGTIVDTGLVEN